MAGILERVGEEQILEPVVIEVRHGHGVSGRKKPLGDMRYARIHSIQNVALSRCQSRDRSRDLPQEKRGRRRVEGRKQTNVARPAQYEDGSEDRESLETTEKPRQERPPVTPQRLPMEPKETTCKVGEPGEEERRQRLEAMQNQVGDDDDKRHPNLPARRRRRSLRIGNHEERK